MGSIADIQTIKVGDELHVCPQCGYDHGFHTSFARKHSGNDMPESSARTLDQVILICPECGARYDVGWTCTLKSTVE